MYLYLLLHVYYRKRHHQFQRELGEHIEGWGKEHRWGWRKKREEGKWCDYILSFFFKVDPEGVLNLKYTRSELQISKYPINIHLGFLLKEALLQNPQSSKNLHFKHLTTRWRSKAKIRGSNLRVLRTCPDWRILLSSRKIVTMCQCPFRRETHMAHGYLRKPWQVQCQMAN